MVTLRAKERKSYAVKLELPSDVESENASATSDHGDEPGPSTESRRRLPTPDEDDSDGSMYQAESPEDDEIIPISEVSDSEDEDFDAEVSDGSDARQAKRRHGGRDGALDKGKTSKIPRRISSTGGVTPGGDDFATGDDLVALLAAPTRATPVVRERMHSRKEIVLGSMPSKPFGHTRLNERPQLGHEVTESLVKGADPTKGLDPAARLALLEADCRRYQLEMPWDKWLGNPWSADAYTQKERETVTELAGDSYIQISAE
jgi:hypothetical protein